MSDIIKRFYEENNIPKSVLEQKLKTFDKHKDIAAEFEIWIKEWAYREDTAVTIEGYTEKQFADIYQSTLMVTELLCYL